MFPNLTRKARAVWTGVFILVAYGVLAGSVTDSPMVIMVADVISGLAVISIAVLMYPLFSPQGQGLTWAYMTLKSVEGGLMVLSGFLFLFPATRELRGPLYENIHVYAFIVSAILFYLLLLRGKLIPAFVCWWGLAGIGTLTITTLGKLINQPMTILSYFLVLIITNEIFLAIWLFTKGFRGSDG